MPRVRELPQRVTHPIHAGLEALTRRAHQLLDDPALILNVPQPRSTQAWAWHARPPTQGRHERE